MLLSPSGLTQIMEVYVQSKRSLSIWSFEQRKVVTMSSSLLHGNNTHLRITTPLQTELKDFYALRVSTQTSTEPTAVGQHQHPQHRLRASALTPLLSLHVGPTLKHLGTFIVGRSRPTMILCRRILERNF